MCPRSDLPRATWRHSVDSGPCHGASSGAPCQQATGRGEGMKYCYREERDFPDDEFVELGQRDIWLHTRPPLHTQDGATVPPPRGGQVPVPIPAPPSMPLPDQLPVPYRLDVAEADFPEEARVMLPSAEPPAS